MMVIVILRDNGQASDWASFEQEVTSILGKHASLVHGIWPAVQGWKPGVTTAIKCLELPDNPDVIMSIRAELSDCRKRHGAEQVAWFAPELIEAL